MHLIDLKVEADLLLKNKEIARKNREFFEKNGIKVVNIMGAIGSGKTTLIEGTVKALKNSLRIGAILGDVAGDSDFQRISKLGIKAVMINTGKECHLDANLIYQEVSKFHDVDLLLIENVGNLICPTDFYLGEDLRVVMVSVTEGEDVIEKHPEIFRIADLIIINKISLADAVGVNVDRMESCASRLSRARILRMDLKEKVGLEEWLEFIRGVLNVSGNSREG